MSVKNEPRIITFLCNWCSYPSSDLAGISRLQYPPNIRPLRVMCSGRIDPQHIIRAFLAGFDAAMVLGCHPGDCHYLNGNFYAEKKIKMLSKFLDMIGIGHERIYLDWVAAPECSKFARVVKRFTEKIKSLGCIKITEELKMRLLAAEKTVTSEKLRTLVAKQYPLETRGNVYQEKVSENQTEKVIDNMLEETYVETLILEAVRKSSLSPVDIASAIGKSVEIVSFHLPIMWNQGKIRKDGNKDDYPTFTSM